MLPIAIGKATRMFDYFLDKHKEYVAEFTFGMTTDTLDAEGNIIEKCDYIPTKEKIIEILPSLIGVIDQIPPQYSAKKVNGRCAYDLARAGQIVDLKPKRIEIYDIKLLEVKDNKFTFLIECSGGTYIRSIARDIATLVNSKAYMSKLIRTKSGKFDINNSYTLDELKHLKLEDSIINIEEIFDYPIINLSPESKKNLLDGKFVNVIENSGNYFIKCDTILIGIGQVINSVLKLKTYLEED